MSQQELILGSLDLVRRIAAGMAARPRSAPASRSSAFDADYAYRWIRKHQPDERLHRTMMKFAQWLFKTGTTSRDSICAILRDLMERRPCSPYAYYAPGGTARDVRVAQHNARLSEAENEAFKAADRAFLSQ
jgi:hypothetical protein